MKKLDEELYADPKKKVFVVRRELLVELLAGYCRDRHCEAKDTPEDMAGKGVAIL